MPRTTKTGLYLTLLLSAVMLGGTLFWLGGASSQVIEAAPLATTWYVDTTGEDGDDCQSAVTACETVGAAISKAADDDTILVASGVYTENLNNTKDLAIIGAAQASTILDGDQAGRVLANTGELTMQNLTIRNGLDTDIFGGGILNYAELTLSNTLVVSNSGGTGGGINNRGYLHLLNSVVAGNSAAGSGGGIYNYDGAVLTITNSLIDGNEAHQGGAVYSRFTELTIVDATIRHNIARDAAGGMYIMGGTTVLSATTVHNNRADAGGGGIVNWDAVFTVINSTVSDNTALSAGGMHIIGASDTNILNSTFAYNHKINTGGAGGIAGSSTATTTWQSSIVANNDGSQCLAFGAWTSLDNNLSSDSTCAFTQPDDLQNRDPMLGPLADYGGPTPTRALMPGSPAIDAGDNATCPPTDQRGVTRPVDGDNDGAAVCDIGSYEARQQIAISDAAVVEGDSDFTSVVFTVTLTPTSTQPITVAYAVVGDTATAGVDFDAGEGTVTFAPDQSIQFITVTVHGDTDDEPDETFFVDLAESPMADLVDAQAVGTIIDDDGLPSLTISDQSVDEGNSGSIEAVFEVALSPVSGQTVSVDYRTKDGTAVSGGDYAAISGTLSFDPGESAKSITVTVNGDLIDEGESESFTVELDNEVNAGLADGQGAGVIMDDDLAKISMGYAPQVIEGDVGETAAVFSVTLSTATSFTVTVDFASADGVVNGAEAGNDYTAISGTLTFDPGETLQLVEVIVYGDTSQEPDEIFSVALSNPDPINIQANTAYATILNDDFLVYLPLVIK